MSGGEGRGEGERKECGEKGAGDRRLHSHWLV